MYEIIYGLPWMTISWWRHQMETFSALLALCVGNSPVTGESPSHRPVTRSFDAFFDLRLNKLFSKQSWGWWFETPSRSSWRHCNVVGHESSDVIDQWLSRVTQSSVETLADRFKSDQKVIHARPYGLFLRTIYVLNTRTQWNNHRSFLSPLSPRTALSFNLVLRHRHRIT